MPGKILSLIWAVLFACSAAANPAVAGDNNARAGLASHQVQLTPASATRPVPSTRPTLEHRIRLTLRDARTFGPAVKYKNMQIMFAGVVQIPADLSEDPMQALEIRAPGQRIAATCYPSVRLSLDKKSRALLAPSTTTRPHEKNPATQTHPTSAPAGPKTLAMTVYPRAVPSPILQYTLLPRQADRRVGNAALFYFQAALNLTAFKGDDTLDRYADLPLDQLPQGEVAAFLRDRGTDNNAEAALRNAELAAHCQSCDWQWAVRPKHQLGPDIGGLEQFSRLARLIVLQARLQMARGQYDRAARSLQVGFDLAHRLGHDGTVIHALVAGGIEAYMIECVREWIQRPDAPNLYWALGHLPRPFYDPRGIMEYDRAVSLSAIPALKPVDPRHAPAHLLWKIVHPNFLAPPRGGDGPIKEAIARIGVWFKYAGDYGKARQYLFSVGLSGRQIEQMGYARVMGVYINHLYQSWSDRWLACADLPYWRARQRLDRLNAQWKAFIQSGPTGELLGIFGLNTQRRLQKALARPDRRLATFRTIEGLRAYAAEHDGHPPVTLDELIVPVPVDPFTGKPFAYRRTAGGFRLDAPQGSHKSFVPEIYNVMLGSFRHPE